MRILTPQRSSPKLCVLSNPKGSKGPAEAGNSGLAQYNAENRGPSIRPYEFLIMSRYDIVRVSFNLASQLFS